MLHFPAWRIKPCDVSFSVDSWFNLLFWLSSFADVGLYSDLQSYLLSGVASCYGAIAF